MRKLIIILAAIFCLQIIDIKHSYGQDYNTSLGVGLGPDISLNFKHFVSERSAIELQGGINIPRKGAMLSAVYQYHAYLANGFNFYFGGGLNVGALRLDLKRDAVFAIGFAPTVGFEYAFATAPVALAIDYKPNINFTTNAQWDLLAFKIRFTW